MRLANQFVLHIIGVLQMGGSVSAFSRRRERPPPIYTQIVVADRFHTKCDFTRKKAVLRFWAPFGGPLWGLRGNVRWLS